MNAEFNEKLNRVRGRLKTGNARAALLGRQASFSWLSCGHEAHVALASERAAGQFLVTAKKVYLLANQIEMPRLQDECLRGLGVEPLLFDWYQADGAAKALAQVVDPGAVISDTGDLGTQMRVEALASLRYSLLPVEVRRLVKLGRDAETVMNLACRALQPGMSEFDAAALLAAEIYRVGASPTVALIAFDERIRRYRHPIPVARKLKRVGMLVLCARRHGLVVSLTRLVHFGKMPAELRRRHAAVCAVDAAFIGNTRVGVPVKEIFARGVEAYAKNGFADEWYLHHQGGPAGYQPREYVGTPDVAGAVLENQMFAWNPSITGTKSEDTILATPKGPQIVTPARDWPMLECEFGGETFLRPDILVR